MISEPSHSAHPNAQASIPPCIHNPPARSSEYLLVRSIEDRDPAIWQDWMRSTTLGEADISRVFQVDGYDRAISTPNAHLVRHPIARAIRR